MKRALALLIMAALAGVWVWQVIPRGLSLAELTRRVESAKAYLDELRRTITEEDVELRKCERELEKVKARHADLATRKEELLKTHQFYHRPLEVRKLENALEEEIESLERERLLLKIQIDEIRITLPGLQEEILTAEEPRRSQARKEHTQLTHRLRDLEQVFLQAERDIQTARGVLYE